ncbi:Retrovirus-related Pol polyprotein from transposon 412 [Araneus ventricosus]|uniref:Retrovirus-related Pol polyprotein from transposon 412 n=1 Tax=Araneus ventricosus TaxID=182803 RepID=A0A4Y2MHJ0_ARAVE|nr:Retrovirus-related Pol polyprotein from transposon 412 [Araneus ventricosus]
MLLSLLAPLTETLKGKPRKEKINWRGECTRAFKELKEKLSQQPILYVPDFNKEFKLQTDASNSGMGVILAQNVENDKEHPVLYLSTKFSKTEKKYSTTERECAAIIFAVKKLQCYLDERTKFLIMTDHNPLFWLKNNASLNPRFMRWALALQPYNYTVVHRSGKNHKNVDALNRTPWPD